MFSPEVNFLVSQEQQKDLLQDIEHQRLLQAAGHRQGVGPNSHRKAANWLGKQMVKWGEKLENYGTTLPSNRMNVETRRG